MTDRIALLLGLAALLLGPVSGAGNGTVTYRLKPNDTRGARRAGIFIARQEFSVTQQTSALESPPSAASFTPETGSGPTHLLQLTVTDPNGASDIDIVQVTFQGPTNRSCLVMLRPPYRLVYLFTDNGVWLDPQTMGADANLQHNVCGVDVSKVTMSASGNDLKLTLPMVFSPQIGSRVTGKIWVRDTTERQAEFRGGDWQVPSDSCNLALSSGTVEAPAGGGTGQIHVQTAPGCPWLVGSAVRWISLTSEPRGSWRTMRETSSTAAEKWLRSSSPACMERLLSKRTTRDVGVCPVSDRLPISTGRAIRKASSPRMAVRTANSSHSSRRMRRCWIRKISSRKSMAPHRTTW